MTRRPAGCPGSPGRRGRLRATRVRRGRGGSSASLVLVPRPDGVRRPRPGRAGRGDAREQDLPRGGAPAGRGPARLRPDRRRPRLRLEGPVGAQPGRPHLRAAPGRGSLDLPSRPPSRSGPLGPAGGRLRLRGLGGPAAGAGPRDSPLGPRRARRPRRPRPRSAGSEVRRRRGRSGPFSRGPSGPRAAAALALYRSTDPPSFRSSRRRSRTGTPRREGPRPGRSPAVPRPGSEERASRPSRRRRPGDRRVGRAGPRAPRGRVARSRALLALAKGAASTGPAIQALLALDRLAAKDAERRPERKPREATETRAAVRRRRHPGSPWLRSRSFAGSPAKRRSRELAGVGGRRGGPARGRRPREPRGGRPRPGLRARVPARVGRASSTSGSARPRRCRSFPADRLAPWLDALLADPAARVRMEAVSRLPRDAAPALASRLVRALADADGSVQAVALDVAAPLASGPGADAAVQRGLAARPTPPPSPPASPTSSRRRSTPRRRSPKEGCALLAARRDDADDLVRVRARRLLVETCGEDPGTFVRRPFATRLSAADYRRLAQLGRDAVASSRRSRRRGARSRPSSSRARPR